MEETTARRAPVAAVVVNLFQYVAANDIAVIHIAFVDRTTRARR